MPDESDEIDLRQYLLPLAHGWYILVALAVIGALLAAGYSWFEPRYRVTAQLAASSSNPVISTLAMSDEVMTAVISAAGPALAPGQATPAELRKALTITQAANAFTIQLTASADSEAHATAIIQAWSQVLDKAVEKAYSGNTTNALQAQLAALKLQLSDAIQAVYDAAAVANDIQTTLERLHRKPADSPAAAEDQAVLVELSLRAAVGKSVVQFSLNQLPAQTVAQQILYLTDLQTSLATRQQALQARRDKLQADILTTQTQLAQMDFYINEPIALSQVRVDVDPPHHTRDVALGGGAGLALAVLFLWGRAWWRVNNSSRPADR